MKEVCRDKVISEMNSSISSSGTWASVGDVTVGQPVAWNASFNFDNSTHVIPENGHSGG